MSSGYDLDDVQLALIGYARFYQQIFELLPHEKPEDTLLEDDTALDRWWEQFVMTRTREIARSFGKTHAARQSGPMPVAEFRP